MARIRTIKPEFWTDGKIVQLPFDVRLLFIGLFNFVDDHGYGWFDYDRIEMQIFPADPMGDRLHAAMDLLEASGLIQKWLSEPELESFFRITNWEKHQKVDKKGKCKFPRESSRRFPIPSEVRRAVGLKYGARPGETVGANCYYCGEHGVISWTQRRNSSPGFVYTSLTFDHVIPQSLNGQHSVENIVLCCKSCNSSKGAKDFTHFVESALAKIRESSRGFPTEKEKEKEKEKETKNNLPRKLAKDAEPFVNALVVQYCERWKEAYKSPKSPPISGKDIGLLKNILKTCGEQRAHNLICAYLQMPDQWFMKRTHDVETLHANLKKVALFADSGKFITAHELNQMDRDVTTKKLIDSIREEGI